MSGQEEVAVNGCAVQHQLIFFHYGNQVTTFTRTHPYPSHQGIPGIPPRYLTRNLTLKPSLSACAGVIGYKTTVLVSRVYKTGNL
jgi:hypothetical protein